MTEHAPDTFPADAPPPGSYTLDPEQTAIHANVKAMFGLFTVRGTFRLRSGQVSITADPGASGVRASIEAGSFASGNATRDTDVISPPCWTRPPGSFTVRAHAATATAGWWPGR